MPSTVSIVEDVDLGLRRNCSFWESCQAVFLHVLLSQELGLNASVVVGISTLEKTYARAHSQTRPRTYVGERGSIPNSVQYWNCHESQSGSTESGGPATAKVSGSVSARPRKKASKAYETLKLAAKPSE